MGRTPVFNRLFWKPCSQLTAFRRSSASSVTEMFAANNQQSKKGLYH